MSRLYQYVGPADIKARSSRTAGGKIVRTMGDVAAWLTHSVGRPSVITATFIVDANGWLRIADRRSEHVACAAGEAVLSAGEITFTSTKNGIEVTGVTNQSTGYCPELSSWTAVEAALNRAGLIPPSGFSTAFEFRRCPGCQSINLIKDQYFRCEVCRSELPDQWNLAPTD